MTLPPFKRFTSCLVLLGPIAVACSGNADPSGATSTSDGANSGASERSNTGGATAASGGSRPGDAVASSGSKSQGGAGGSGASAASGGKVIGGSSNGGSKATGGGKATGGTSTSLGGPGMAGKGAEPPASGGSTGDATKSTGCGKTTSLKGQSTKTISVGGTERTYILRLPDNYDENHPYRLITSLHPLNGTAAGVANGSTGTNYQFYGLWKLAAGSTIFVAPQGIKNAWPNTGGDDVAFIKALIAELETSLCIDTSRVFSEGFSMGGSMSYALACAMPDTYRGVAAHSGGPMSGCDKTNRKPVAYFMTHGTKDGVCTYPDYGVPQINDFAKLNGCDALDIPNTLKPTDSSGKTPVCADFAKCTEGYPTRSCIFVGDHTPSPGGEAATWVPGETWKFISQF